MSKFIFSLLVLFAATSSVLQSQQLAGTDKVNEEIFTARVKQFGEFADRFNLSTDFRGNPADSAFIKKMPREKMISSLFDASDERNSKQSAHYSEYSALKQQFIKELTGKNILLDKHSGGIIAEARSRVTFNGKPETISIFLNQEVTGKGGVKWVMLSAGDFLDDVFLTDTTMVRFISPNSNETAFLNLGRALEDKGHLQAYAYSGFRPDNLSVFLYLVSTGAIKFEYAEEVVYHIISIPGWYFKVRDFNRNQLNSGWLISDLKKGNYELKDLFN
ncbi:MAG TPA: hypothetical protein VK155_12070 [Bacteroidales bacterium]|nr:hypothetical protein [Bacteroidales bacterium]